ncbi:conserved Plasmodium protein, unknown function [Plasmodium chabaudi chabaudi]|uniref:TOG domain-containing protein n=1 Tax=Plasmodium chabaudi chabaudi TaxID=31271 RepID=A0A1C6YTE3_PLACU|nr:conserved Plasmodium protein, unknown function [Plasmodium chabaudi chabaudi]
MESINKENLKIKYKILAISSTDKDHDVTNLLKNTGKEIHNPWISEKNCSYPQEIILQIKPAKIKYLEFLCHEYAISKKIEIFMSNNNKDYLKAGFFRFNDNTSTRYCARELKYVYLPCTIKCTYIKFKLHNPYHNLLNINSQIGLYYINIIPEDVILNIPSEINSTLKLNSLDNKKSTNGNNCGGSKKSLLRKIEDAYNSNITNTNNTNISSGEIHWDRKNFHSKYDKNQVHLSYEKLESKIRCFEKVKDECVAKEKFDMACELKKIINIFIFLKNTIIFLKGKKKTYVNDENYNKAKMLKEKEIKITIIIKNIEDLKIINDCSKKWYYEWLILYHKELEIYEKEISKIVSNENVKIIKKKCGFLDHCSGTDEGDADLNNILMLICSDNEKKREIGFDLAYKSFEDATRCKTIWHSNLDSLCLIIKRGIFDSGFSIFIKSVAALEKMLSIFEQDFFKMTNRDYCNYNDTNLKYIKFIISSLLKRLDDSNLDVVDICIKTIMMMLHNNFISFKNVFSTILSMLFYSFSTDVTEINEKIIVSLMSFYYSLINKYYTSVKNYINLKKVLEIISLFLQVNIESIKQTSLDFFVNIYNIVENSNEVFEDFLLNVSFDIKNLIINRLNQEENEKNKLPKDNNGRRQSELWEKNNLSISNNDSGHKNSYLYNTYSNIKDISHENNREDINKIENINNDIKRNIYTEKCGIISNNIKDPKLIDKHSKIVTLKNSDLKKDTYLSEIKESSGNSETIVGSKIPISLHKKDAINTCDEKSITREILIKRGRSIDYSTKIEEYDEAHVSPFTCKYCFKTDKMFTEIGLEKHWIKNCPMLCTCPNCFLIVELVVIHDHFLSECSHSYMYTSCEYCNGVVKKSLLDFHVMNECIGKKNDYLSCYYCSLCIESFEIDKWRNHFLSCPKNPRLN